MDGQLREEPPSVCVASGNVSDLSKLVVFSDEVVDLFTTGQDEQAIVEATAYMVCVIQVDAKNPVLLPWRFVSERGLKNLAGPQIDQGSTDTLSSTAPDHKTIVSRKVRSFSRSLSKICAKQPFFGESSWTGEAGPSQCSVTG
jgi:hypothetical protein